MKVDKRMAGSLACLEPVEEMRVAGGAGRPERVNGLAVLGGQRKGVEVGTEPQPHVFFLYRRPRSERAEVTKRAPPSQGGDRDPPD